MGNDTSLTDAQLVREVFAVPLVDAVSQLHDAGSASLSLEDALRVVLLAHDQHLLTEHIVARLRCVDWTAVLARLSMDTSTGRALLLRLLRFLHLLAVPNVCSVSLLFSNTIHKVDDWVVRREDEWLMLAAVFIVRGIDVCRVCAAAAQHAGRDAAQRLGSCDTVCSSAACPARFGD